MVRMPLHEKVALLLRLHRIDEEPQPVPEDLIRLQRAVDELLARAQVLLADGPLN
jgi:hypothetical protein